MEWGLWQGGSECCSAASPCPTNQLYRYETVSADTSVGHSVVGRPEASRGGVKRSSVVIGVKVRQAVGAHVRCKVSRRRPDVDSSVGQFRRLTSVLRGFRFGGSAKAALEQKPRAVLGNCASTHISFAKTCPERPCWKGSIGNSRNIGQQGGSHVQDSN